WRLVKSEAAITSVIRLEKISDRKSRREEYPPRTRERGHLFDRPAAQLAVKIRRVFVVRVQKANEPRFLSCLSHSSDFQGLKTSRGVGAPHAEGGASLAPLISTVRRAPGDVAQLGEHLLCKQVVSGSSPLISTSTLTTE